MKKQKETYVQSPQKNILIYILIAIAVVALAVSVVLYYIYRNVNEYSYFWYALMAFAFFVFSIFLVFFVFERKIRFFDRYYLEYYLFIPLKKISYSEIKYISLSDASYYYFTGRGLLNYWEANKVFYRDGEKIKKQRAQIMVHKENFPIEKLSANMTGDDVWRLGYYEKQTYLAGLFENDCLEKLLLHTECKFYVIGGTYSKFKKELDYLFAKYPEFQQRMIVVT